MPKARTQTLVSVDSDTEEVHVIYAEEGITNFDAATTDVVEGNYVQGRDRYRLEVVGLVPGAL